MTIKEKLNLTSLVLIVTLLTLGLTVFFGYRFVTEKASLANDFDKEVMYLQTMLRGLNEILINDGTPASIQTAKEGLTGYDEIHSRLMTTVQDPKILRHISEHCDPHWQNIKKGIVPFFNHYLDLEDDESLIRAGKLITEAEGIIVCPLLSKNFKYFSRNSCVVIKLT